jgi:polar amino acid transport system substrate-binding protein
LRPKIVAVRWRRSTGLALVGWLLALATAGPAGAADAPGNAGNAASTGVIEVGIKPLDPFVLKGSDGRYSGFSVELWNEIAIRNGWRTEYKWYPDLSGLMAGVSSRKVDAGLAGISITADREKQVDFSYPMFSAGLQVLTTSKPSGSDLGHQAGNLFSAAVGRYVLSLLVVLLTAGAVSAVSTWRRSEMPWRSRMSDGVFRAAAVGLAGDIGEPRNLLGKMIAFAWLVAGIVFVSLFTATITTQLTVNSIQTTIRGVADLPGKRVVTVRGSTAEAYLHAHAITYRAVDSVDAAYPLLAAGAADAIVFDTPVLQHHLAVADGGNEVLAGPVFAPEDYGIAFPTDSALRKKVNLALLRMHADGTYAALYRKYFGSATGGS